MKRKITESIEIPEGVSCEYHLNTLKCTKGSVTLHKILSAPGIKAKVEGNKIHFEAIKGARIQYKTMKSFIAHIKNLFSGLDSEFVYKLESVNVHFPMTLKIEKNKLIINNFIGEKTPRVANILPNVEVEAKGPLITVKSHDKEAAGQTAANFEKATRLRGRDRRIFQDGIFITEKPGEN